jgi:hypothetical protein
VEAQRNLDKAVVALALLIDTMPLDEAWAALLPCGASATIFETVLIDA